MRSVLRRLLAELMPHGCDFAVSRPPEARFGDWSSNAPLEAARLLRQSPAQIGQTLHKQLETRWNGRIELQNGRLNFFMSDTTLVEGLERAAREGAHFGSGDELAGKRILVEFVSSDPTGPLPFSAGRHAAVGEAICRLLEAGGARVTREFYLNDATTSSKIRLLGESVAWWYAHAFGQGEPAEHISNDAWVRAVGAELARRDGAKWLECDRQERLDMCSRAALEAAVQGQKASLERFGVQFDAFVSESSLRSEGRVEALIEKLKTRGHLVEHDGALWLQTSKFGDDADRVLERAGGEPTYFAGDLAYHAWKNERGFDRIINLWSAEHRPYIERTRAALRAAELDEEKFEFLVCEGAVLERDGTPLRLGTGGGNLLLDEEIEEIGADALKFGFVSRPANQKAVVDLELARRDDETSPAYAVALLPSRLARLEREAQARGDGSETPEPASWSAPQREIARLVALWPDEREEAALRRAPERVASYLMELSRAVRELEPQRGARLPLLRAASSAAASALKTLGIDARERF